MGKIRFFLSEAFRSLWRNYFMTIAAVVTVFLSMFLLGVVMVFVYNINAVLKDLPSNPLPASFEVALKDPKLAGTVAVKFDGRPIVEEVRYGKEIAERIFKVTSVVRNISGVFVLLLGAVSILLISNTIRLSIYARRREVEIMKLVGATNWFIRWPFIIEGLTVGLLGAASALALVILGTGFVMDRIRENLVFLTVPFDAVSTVQITLVILGVGAVIGAVGSGLGLRRFLNV